MARSPVALLAFALAMGCRDEPTVAPEPAPSAPVPVPPAVSASPASPAPTRVEIHAAPADGEVAPLVAEELAKARAAGRDLVVYVGATWCEPCQYFHEAAAAGKLDSVFPTLVLLEFDLDRDKERLERAGYASRMIPLFVAPRPDGSPSEHRMQGSIKGPAAVGEITPRLRELLAAGRAL